MKKRVKKLKNQVSSSLSQSLDIVDALFIPLSSSKLTASTSSTSSISNTTFTSSTSEPPLSPTTPSIPVSNFFDILGINLSTMSAPAIVPQGLKPLPAGASQEETNAFFSAILVNINATTTATFSKISHLESKVTTLESEVTVLKRELRAVKESVNKTELAARNLSARVLGLPATEDESPATIKKNVYDKILKPVLQAAKDKNQITSIPQLNTIIEDAFRLNYAAKDAQGRTLPAPVIIKFKDKAMRTIIFQNKRDAIPAPSSGEVAAGVRYYLIVEDLTSPTLKKLKDLRDDDRVSRAWTTEGAIRYTLVATPEVVRKCPGAFAPLSEFIKS